MYLGISFLLWVYVISCLAIIIGTYVFFKLDDTVEHTIYGMFNEEIYGFFILMAFVPLANTTIALSFGLAMLYYFLIHKRLVKICKRIKI